MHLIPGTTKAPARVFAMAAKCMNRRVREGSNVKDLFYHLVSIMVFLLMPLVHLRAIDGRGRIGTGEATHASCTFRRSPCSNCWLGHDRYGTVLWYYLILDPPKSDRLRNEVDAYFPQGEEPSEFARMVNMPYLNAYMWVFADVTSAVLILGGWDADFIYWQ